jgi:antitoxin (DNA-binding transcriptional repressor) of toxin-antitoxin stability system
MGPYLDAAMDGQTIIIERNGLPAARLCPPDDRDYTLLETWEDDLVKYEKQLAEIDEKISASVGVTRINLSAKRRPISRRYKRVVEKLEELRLAAVFEEEEAYPNG